MDVFARDVTLAGLSKAAGALSARKTLIAQNIANVNTPGYKRRDIAFADELATAMKSGSTRKQRADAVSRVVASEVIEDSFFYRADMGGVDLDREMVEHAKTSIMGSAVTQLISKKIRQYKMVIKDGRI